MTELAFNSRNFNKKDLTYLSFKIYNIKNKLNYRIDSVKKNLFLVNQKLFLIDIIIDKDNYSKEIINVAKEYYDEILKSDTEIKKELIYEKVDNFLKTLN